MKNVKPGVIALLFLINAANGIAQTAEPVTKTADPLFNNLMVWVLFGVSAVVIIATILTMVKINAMMFRELQNMSLRAQGLPVPETVIGQSGDDFWVKMKKKYWEDVVPIEKEAAIMGHHEFDGIRELDNNLPPWWVNMFYLTIIYAVVYMFYYQWGGPGLSQNQEYEQEMEAARMQKALALSSAADKVNEETVVALTDKNAISDGQFIFKQACAACHGQLGEGGVGPNMTDDNWIHGGGVKNIFKTIKYGVPEKGMKSWQAEVKPSDMQKVASYILTLRGTNPPNPKAAQGEIWVEPTTADTSKTLQAEVKN